MRVVIQRVSEAAVSVDDRLVAKIGEGLLVLLGIEDADNNDDTDWMVNKITNIRIFNDEANHMNLSLKDVGGELLVVSQFTLHANTKKGKRPSFVRAAKPETAIALYEEFIKQLSESLGRPVVSGEFGAMMQVQLINDGPVTIIIDSKQRGF